MPLHRAVVLLSGGLDSATVAALARRDGFETFALSFSYGQRHSVELDAAPRVAAHVGVADHKIVTIDLRTFGGSALTDDIDVPKDRQTEEMSTGIPVTYVPARNTIFLSYALAWAEVLSSSNIYLGVNALDYSGYPDCRPEYIASFQTMAPPGHQGGGGGIGPADDPRTAHRLDEGPDHHARSEPRRRLLDDGQLLRPRRRRSGVRSLRLVPSAPQGLRRGEGARRHPVPERSGRRLKTPGPDS